MNDKVKEFSGKITYFTAYRSLERMEHETVARAQRAARRAHKCGGRNRGNEGGGSSAQKDPDGGCESIEAYEEAAQAHSHDS